MVCSSVRACLCMRGSIVEETSLFGVQNGKERCNTIEPEMGCSPQIQSNFMAQNNNYRILLRLELVHVSTFVYDLASMGSCGVQSCVDFGHAQNGKSPSTLCDGEYDRTHATLRFDLTLSIPSSKYHSIQLFLRLATPQWPAVELLYAPKRPTTSLASSKWRSPSPSSSY